MIELHDSVVADIVVLGNQVIVLFSRAYVHTSEGRAGWDAGSGGWQCAALVLSGAFITGNVGELPAAVWDGSLMLSGTVLQNEIPIPCSHLGEVTLKLHLDNQSQVVLRGGKASLILLGEAVYCEKFPGAVTELSAV